MTFQTAVPVYFADPHLLPRDFKYPASYVAYVASDPPYCIGPINEDWCFIHVTQIEAYFRRVREAFPERHLVPFMRRNGDDGVACFDWSTPSSDPKVVHCQIFQDRGCWPKNITFTEWLERIPPRDPEDD